MIGRRRAGPLGRVGGGLFRLVRCWGVACSGPRQHYTKSVFCVMFFRECIYTSKPRVLYREKHDYTISQERSGKKTKLTGASCAYVRRISFTMFPLMGARAGPVCAYAVMYRAASANPKPRTPQGGASPEKVPFTTKR